MDRGVREPGRNIRLDLEYDGSGFAGWQIQASGRTVQGVLERHLRRILGERIHLVAAGRTDRGVHARQQVVNFWTRSTLVPGRIQGAVNGLAGPEIAVTRARVVGAGFHARFGVRRKQYRYTILNRRVPSPLTVRQAYLVQEPLDVRAMQREAQALVGRHDFRAFEGANGRGGRDPVKAVAAVRIRRRGRLITIDVEGGGFLYGMVRTIVGTLVEIGRGRAGPGHVARVLRGRDRRRAGPRVPAHGLCLMRVWYTVPSGDRRGPSRASPAKLDQYRVEFALDGTAGDQ